MSVINGKNIRGSYNSKKFINRKKKGQKFSVRTSVNVVIRSQGQKVKKSQSFSNTLFNGKV